MKSYADTSFLFSFYAVDAFSERSDAWLIANPQRLCFTEFNEFELRNALSLAVFRRRMSAAEASASWQRVRTDLGLGWLAATTISWSEAFQRAGELAAEFSPDLGTRSLDVLHVAVAVIIGADHLLSFDSRQRELAVRAGLQVLP